MNSHEKACPIHPIHIDDGGDAEILELYRKRDEKAISRTKERYGRLINSVAANILKSAQDAEECENEVYLRAWNSIPPASPQRLAAYLCRIARGVALDRYDYNHAAKRGEALPLEELEDYLGVRSDAEDRLSEKELTGLLNSFLKAQDYNTRVIFLRRYWFSDSVSDIARRLHVSQSMVKSRVSRTLKKLKQYLIDMGYDLH